MSTGISLHIGVNRVDADHYAGWEGPLTACEADAEDINLIASAAGYRSDVLLTKDATRGSVVDHIVDAAESLSSGDIFVLSYSGHGGQVPDADGDETDFRDETWCLYDGQFLDDELRMLWGQFNEGVRVLVLSDSCHSGTVTRVPYEELSSRGLVSRPVSRVDQEAPRFRAMPDEAAFRTYRKNRAFYDAIAEKVRAQGTESVDCTVRLLSGCQDNQLSLDGTFNGLFTATLLRVWNDGRFTGNYAAFHKAILSRMPPTQSPNHFVIGPPDPAYDAQRPFQV